MIGTPTFENIGNQAKRNFQLPIAISIEKFTWLIEELSMMIDIFADESE